MINFDEMIDNYLFRKFRPKGVGRYYPSEAGMCLRKVWYTYKYPKETEPELLKIFEMGNILHNFVVEVLKSEKNPDVELVESELPVKIQMDDFLVSGRIDDVIIVKSSGKTFLVEVKSCKSLNYIKEPQHHHIMQIQLYMRATGIHNGILLYIQKNDLQSKIFNIPYDKEIAESALERFSALHKYLTEDKLPPQEARNDSEMSWMCTYCEYKDRCEGE